MSKLFENFERLKLIEAGKRLHNQATESKQDVAEYDDIAQESEVSDTESYDTVYNEGPYRLEVKSRSLFASYLKLSNVAFLTI